MRYVFKNDGLSGMLVDADYTAQAGEVIFEGDLPTDAQLAEAFPGFAAAKAKQTAAQEIAQLEMKITPRRLREAMVTPDLVVDAQGTTAAQWLANINDRIEALR